MAYQTTELVHDHDRVHRAISATKSFFRMVGQAMISTSAANRRLLIVEKLQAKSDAELADIGLRREDIVRHVFRDMLDV